MNYCKLNSLHASTDSESAECGCNRVISDFAAFGDAKEHTGCVIRSAIAVPVKVSAFGIGQAVGTALTGDDTNGHSDSVVIRDEAVGVPVDSVVAAKTPVAGGCR